MTAVIAAPVTGINADGDVVIDGVVVCPLCLEDKGSPFCCPKPAGAGAGLVVVWDAEDLAELRKELRSAPVVRVAAGVAS